jgi:hypothetical protein
MGTIAEYTQPDDFDGLVNAIRAFLLVDLRLDIPGDYTLTEEKHPHHRFSLEACGAATISVTDGDAQVNVLSDDEIELLGLVRDTDRRQHVLTARDAIKLIRWARVAAEGCRATVVIIRDDEHELLDLVRGRGDKPPTVTAGRAVRILLAALAASEEVANA